MSTDKELSSQFITSILDNENINSVELADLLGVTKSFVSSVKNGRSALPKKKYELLINLKPEYEKYGKVNCSKIFDNCNYTYTFKSNLNTIDVVKYENSYLTTDFNMKNRGEKTFYQIDEKILRKNYPMDLQNAKFEVVTIANNTCEPNYMINDNIIINTSVKSFVNGFIFAFIYNGEVYVKEIRKLPNSIKCLPASNNEFDYEFEASEDQCEIIGLVVPKVRF